MKFISLCHPGTVVYLGSSPPEAIVSPGQLFNGDNGPTGAIVPLVQLPAWSVVAWAVFSWEVIAWSVVGAPTKYMS